jgi:hypothetical protein
VTVKKAILPPSGLPPVNAENKYAYRYRIVSEDKNRTSSWSPIKIIDAPPVTLLTDSQGAVTTSGNSITATWSDENNRPKYDVFVKFDTDASYFYHGTTPIHTYSFIKKTGANTVSVAIQVEGISVDGTKLFYGASSNPLLVYLKLDEDI